MSKVKEVREKQLQLLSEYSEEIVQSRTEGKELPLLTDAMIKFTVILEPEIQSEFFPVYPFQRDYSTSEARK